MTSVKVTKAIAQHIVDCVMGSTKRKYEMSSIFPKVREYMLSTMPEPIQKISQDPELCEYLQWGTVYVSNQSVAVRGYTAGASNIPEALKQEIRELRNECDIESNQRHQVALNLHAQLMACKNLNKVAEVFPEFTKYFQQFLTPDPVYPIQPKSVLDNLKELGYKP